MGNDIILYFAGNGKRSGESMTPKDGVTDDDILNAIADLKSKNPIRLTGWGGTGGTGKLDQSAIQYIIKNSPSDKLIIYGYSAGGMDALQLCQQIFQHRGARDLIDLLITVDAATGTGSIPRQLLKLSPNVAINLNYWTYKTASMMSDSHGTENIAINSRATKLKNRQIEDSDHHSIRLMTKNKCLDAIQRVLNGQSLDDF